MKEAVIVATARTPIGKAYRGGFNTLGGASLGAASVAEVVRRAGIDPARVDDVIMGCAMQQGATGGNRRLQPFGPETGQRGHFEMLAEQAPRRVEVEIPVRLAGPCGIDGESGRPAFRIEDFRRADPLQRRRNLLGRYLDQDELAARQV